MRLYLPVLYMLTAQSLRTPLRLLVKGMQKHTKYESVSVCRLVFPYDVSQQGKLSRRFQIRCLVTRYLLTVCTKGESH